MNKRRSKKAFTKLMNGSETTFGERKAAIVYAIKYTEFGELSARYALTIRAITKALVDMLKPIFELFGVYL